MGKHRDRTIHKNRSKTLPSSPSHSFSSSSSSDFEFTIAISPRKSSAALCPADELFYKGQLLPLHLSPRISMVRTLLLSSSSSSSSATTTTARDSSSSTDSSSSSSSFASDLALLAAGIDSSRPSSAADEDSDLLLSKKLINNKSPKSTSTASNFFSLSRFSSVFKKDPKSPAPPDPDRSGSRKTSSSSSSAKEVIRKYLKKVKPFYDKLSQKQPATTTTTTTTSFCAKPSVNRSETASAGVVDEEITASNCSGKSNLTTSFSGNLGYPRRTRRSCVASCPSSMRSSPSHSGVLSRTGFSARGGTTSYSYSDSSTMEELQSAIQGAIAHCKNSMGQSNKAGISNEI